ncbi:Retrovirus-related Pol polyprotein from transposon [Ceratobasidium sp. AG-Ba]|nr:Retrovirus-related Pol polyprotein from transposon [Ceratobasidium sp. AG-Ba]
MWPGVTSPLCATILADKREPYRDPDTGRFAKRPPAEPTAYPTPAQSTLFSSPVRVPGTFSFLEREETPTLVSRVPFPAGSPFEFLPELPPSSPARSQRSVTPTTPVHINNPRLTSSPDEVEDVLEPEDFDVADLEIEPEDQTVTNITNSSAPVQPVVATAPAAKKMPDTPDLKLVYQRLGQLKRFGDNGDPVTEAEYRESFLDIVDGLADELKAKLWSSNLAHGSHAWWWYKLLVGTSEGKAKARKWSTLEPEIERRWPTPQLNVAAYRRATREAFESHRLDVAAIADALLNDSTMSLPHQVWAQEHFARGNACNSTDADRVAYTLRHCVDYVVIQLLPKQHDYNTDFQALCTDIGNINPRALYYTWKNRNDVDSLLADRISSLSVAQPTLAGQAYGSFAHSASLTPNGYANHTPAPLSPAPGPTVRLSPQTPTLGTSTLAQHQKPTHRYLPSTPDPRQATRFRSDDGNPARNPPPHSTPLPSLPAPLETPVQSRTIPPKPNQPSTMLEQGPPPVSAVFVAKLQAVQNPNAFLPELVDKNNADTQARYRADVLRYQELHGDREPFFNRPYPLSPGTRRQTLNLCTKCAKGNHPNSKCPAESKSELVPENERLYRDMLVSDLRKKKKSSSRAGVQWNTPTPAPRPRDVNQVKVNQVEVVEESEALWEQYGYESGNEQGRRA